MIRRVRTGRSRRQRSKHEERPDKGIPRRRNLPEPRIRSGPDDRESRHLQRPITDSSGRTRLVSVSGKVGGRVSVQRSQGPEPIHTTSTVKPNLRRCKPSTDTSITCKDQPTIRTTIFPGQGRGWRVDATGSRVPRPSQDKGSTDARHGSRHCKRTRPPDEPKNADDIGPLLDVTFSPVYGEWEEVFVIWRCSTTLKETLTVLRKYTFLDETII